MPDPIRRVYFPATCFICHRVIPVGGDYRVRVVGWGLPVDDTGRVKIGGFNVAAEVVHPPCFDKVHGSEPEVEIDVGGEDPDSIVYRMDGYNVYVVHQAVAWEAVTIDWGDGAPIEKFGADGLGFVARSHAYGQAGDYQIILASKNGSWIESADVTIEPPPPLDPEFG